MTDQENIIAVLYEKANKSLTESLPEWTAGQIAELSRIMIIEYIKLTKGFEVL